LYSASEGFAQAIVDLVVENFTTSMLLRLFCFRIGRQSANDEIVSRQSSERKGHCITSIVSLLLRHRKCFREATTLSAVVLRWLMLQRSSFAVCWLPPPDVRITSRHVFQ